MTGINGFDGNNWTRTNTNINNNGGVGKQENALPAQKETVEIVKNAGKEYDRDLLGSKDYDYRTLLGFTPSANSEFAAINAKYPNLQNYYFNESPEAKARIGSTANNTFNLLNEIGEFA